jgi:hypothetical protein
MPDMRKPLILSALSPDKLYPLSNDGLNQILSHEE